MTVSCTGFELFDFEQYCDLEILVMGHSRASKPVSFDSLTMVFLTSALW